MSEGKTNFWDFLLRIWDSLDFVGLMILLWAFGLMGSCGLEFVQAERSQRRLEACIEKGNPPETCSKTYAKPVNKKKGSF